MKTRGMKRHRMCNHKIENFEEEKGVFNRFSGIHSLFFIVSLAVFSVSCQPEGTYGPVEQTAGSQNPTIEASPLKQGEGQWKVLASDSVTLTVTAPGAEKVSIFYRPVSAADNQLRIRTLTTMTDPGKGEFSTELKAVRDFAGDVWAEAEYSDGKKRQTEPIGLAAGPVGQKQAGGESLGSVGTDESARSDKITGGKIETAAFLAGQPDINLTVNVPAFELTLWQNGKQVRTYDIGVARKDFPIVIGERKATEVIYNPEWIPPDSEWVSEMPRVEPGERIEAEDPRNPLGKLKIPLGDGYLIHEAASPSDIGNLVSHGCIRMLREDLYDLADKIIAARSLPASSQEIERAKKSTERLVVKLDNPLSVDINYDTDVVEGGILRIFPDIYTRIERPVESLRANLQDAGVDPATLDDQMMKQIVERAKKDQEFMVAISDLRAGRALESGKNLPLTGQKAKGKDDRNSGTRRGRGGQSGRR